MSSAAIQSAICSSLPPGNPGNPIRLPPSSTLLCTSMPLDRPTEQPSAIINADYRLSMMPYTIRHHLDSRSPVCRLLCSHISIKRFLILPAIAAVCKKGSHESLLCYVYYSFNLKIFKSSAVYTLLLSTYPHTHQMHVYTWYDGRHYQEAFCLIN